MKNVAFYFIGGIAAVIFGIVVMIFPSFIVNISAIVFSLVLLIKGIRTLINSLRFDKICAHIKVNGVEVNLDARKNVKSTMLFNGLLSSILGLVALIISITALIKGSEKIMKVMIYIIASGFLISGITGWIENRKMKKWAGLDGSLGEKTLFQLIIAAILFIFPLLIGNVFMYILGAIVIAFGVGYFSWGIYLMKMKKSVETEAKWEDVK